MNDNSSGTSAVWGILASIVLIIALIGGSLYLIGDLGVQRRAGERQSAGRDGASLCADADRPGPSRDGTGA
jgi:hypothetical protein